MSTTQSSQVESVQAAVPVAQSDEAIRTPEQKAVAKAAKKQRKQERLCFFFGWCAGCQAYGSIF